MASRGSAPSPLFPASVRCSLSVIRGSDKERPNPNRAPIPQSFGLHAHAPASLALHSASFSIVCDRGHEGGTISQQKLVNAPS